MDISSFYNISSGVIRETVETSPVYQNNAQSSEFGSLLDKAIESLNTTNAYMSDAENEQRSHQQDNTLVGCAAYQQSLFPVSGTDAVTAHDADTPYPDVFQWK